MKLFKLIVVVCAMVASSQAFSVNSVTTTRKIKENKKCSTWDVRNLKLDEDGVRVKLGDTVDVCYRRNNGIYLFSTIESVFSSRIGDKEGVVAFAVAGLGEECEDFISETNYFSKFNIFKGDKFSGDIDAEGAGLKNINITQVCAKLFVNDPK